MKLSTHSIARLRYTMALQGVESEFGDVVFSYLVYGYSPGSFFTAMLANDAREMMLRAHPSNNISVMKSIMRWLGENLTLDSGYGSLQAVSDWLELSDDVRRSRLEQRNLIFSGQQEIVLILEESPIESFESDF